MTLVYYQVDLKRELSDIRCKDKGEKMRFNFLITSLTVVITLLGPANAEELPMKINGPPQESDSDYFPPATEPYGSTIVQSQNKMQHSPLPSAPYEVMTEPRPTSRETVEQVAAHCDEEVATIWNLQHNLEYQNRESFQKTISAAKTKCDQLKKIAYSLKQADDILLDYQKTIQDVQRVYSDTDSRKGY